MIIKYSNAAGKTRYLVEFSIDGTLLSRSSFLELDPHGHFNFKLASPFISDAYPALS